MDKLPVCPTCGQPFLEDWTDTVARVTVFGHGYGPCEDVYGSESDRPDAALIRLGTLDDYYTDFGTLTVGKGRPPPSDDIPER